MNRRVISDGERNRLLKEPKPLPSGWMASPPSRLVQEKSYRARVSVIGTSGSVFRIDTRQEADEPLSFSCILTFIDADDSEYTRARLNGLHGPHSNKIESQMRVGVRRIPPETMHAHILTERYQAPGFTMDGYAEPVDAYSDFDGAWETFKQIFRCYDADEAFRPRLVIVPFIVDTFDAK